MKKIILFLWIGLSSVFANLTKDDFELLIPEQKIIKLK